MFRMRLIVLLVSGLGKQRSGTLQIAAGYSY
jgi:hypothetical protein